MAWLVTQTYADPVSGYQGYAIIPEETAVGSLAVVGLTQNLQHVRPAPAYDQLINPSAGHAI